jgi:hypothetical protein
VLSLHLVEPALYCIPDPYFQTWSHFRMAKLQKRSYMCLKHREFDMQFWSECKLLELWICDTEIFNLHCLIML